MAHRSFSWSFSKVPYSGISKWLKHVWLVGRLSQSGPMREMTNVRLARPLMGARSLPVANFRRSRFSSSSNACSACQKKRMVWLLSSKPSSYLVARSSASKSSTGLPHTKSSSSLGWNISSACPPHTFMNPLAKASNCALMLSTSTHCTYPATYSPTLALVTGISLPPGTSSCVFHSPHSSTATSNDAQNVAAMSPSNANMSPKLLPSRGSTSHKS
mmetsp:Transcript_53720/g.107898  ORF Transcript_53720/g.107898 Transcript_53720/m.107898 type:complete len:216 (-) Transcript_53720:1459-2106(-)